MICAIFATLLLQRVAHHLLDNVIGYYTLPESIMARTLLLRLARPGLNWFVICSLSRPFPKTRQPHRDMVGECADSPVLSTRISAKLPAFARSITCSMINFFTFTLPPFSCGFLGDFGDLLGVSGAFLATFFWGFVGNSSKRGFTSGEGVDAAHIVSRLKSVYDDAGVTHARSFCYIDGR